MNETLERNLIVFHGKISNTINSHRGVFRILTSNMERFAKLVKLEKLLTIFAKRSILDI